MMNWSSLSGHRNNAMIPSSGAPNGANGQPFPPSDNQLNSSSSMLTGGKKINHKAKGKVKGIKKQCRPRLTGESSNLGKESLEEHKTVEQSWKNLTDQINRRMTTLINFTSIGAKTMRKIFCLFLSHLLCDMKVKGKYWDWLRNCPKVLAIVSQIEENWPLLSNLQKIKENMKKIMADFRARSDTGTPDHETSPSRDSMMLPRGPITRARAKQFKNTIGIMVQQLWKDNNASSFEQVNGHRRSHGHTLLQTKSQSNELTLARF